jgi:Ca2+-transporting ATPase
LSGHDRLPKWQDPGAYDCETTNSRPGQSGCKNPRDRFGVSIARESPDSELPDASWAMGAEDVVGKLGSDGKLGLASGEAAARLRQFGPNSIRARPRRPLLAIVTDQFRSVVVLLLLAAGGLALLFGDNLEAVSILVVILINSGVGFLTEWRAVRSMEALGRLGRVETIVVRDGETTKIPAEDLVPGDIVLREGGDIITADMRLIEAAALQVDESTLTGESLPVEKSSDTLDSDTPLMDRHNMLFKGTAVTRGSARAVVVGTGEGTEIGKISELVRAAEPQQTPLEQRLDAMAQRLVWLVLGIAVVLGAAGLYVHDDPLLAVEIAIALAVAAIPEGLPIVATIALARGMWRMAGHNALVARLSAVETLGATSVILTDKTGTLTENRMAVVSVALPGRQIAMPPELPPGSDASAQLDRLLSRSALCSNATLGPAAPAGRSDVGDPTEVALLFAAAQRGIERAPLLNAYPEVTEFAFDPDTKLMATVHADGNRFFAAVKGAPEIVIRRATCELTPAGERPLDEARRMEWSETVTRLGELGLRTLAIAETHGPGAEADPYHGLVLLGIVALEDPPRAGVADAIRACGEAGIKVAMLTGDHPATARKIAGEVGIVRADESASCMTGRDFDAARIEQSATDVMASKIFARVSPEQKLALIDCFQRHGNIVAMTGDGVNDAPALKKADIGVAMGMRGTAVARDAADMILLDDNLQTIVTAIGQGRAIYDNIRKFVVYLLSCNVSEVLIVALATVAGAPLPLLPLQILYLNLVTDIFPALALGVGEGAPGLMRRSPRPANEPLLTRQHWLAIGAYGVTISVTVLAALAIAMLGLKLEADRAITISFCTLALAQVWHVINMRGSGSGWLVNEITRNPWVLGAALLCVVLVLAAVYVPGVSDVLSLEAPGPAGWAVIVGMSLVPVLAGSPLRRFFPHG